MPALSFKIGLCVLFLPFGQVRAESRFALSIGNNLVAPHEAPLRWAEEDARRVDQILSQMGEVPDDRRLLLLNKTAQDVRLAFERVRGKIEEAARRGERTLLFVFYSGHGDTSSLHLRDTALTLTEIKGLLKQSGSDANIAVVDACHAGRLVRGREKGVTARPPFEISYQRDSGPSGTVIISSSGATEVAQESDELGGSYFTHHFVSGLRGAADRDADKQVTLDEIYGYVYHRTLASSHASTAAVQHPGIDAELAGEGAIVITNLQRAQAHLILPPGLRGDFLIINSQNQKIVAQIVKNAGDKLSVALASATYRVQLRSGSEIFVGQVNLPWGGEHELSENELIKQPFYVALAKGPTHAPSRWGGALAFGAYRSLTPFAERSWAVGGEAFWSPDSDWFLKGRMFWGRSRSHNDLWFFRHSEWNTGIGVGRSLINAGPFEFLVWLGPELVRVSQKLERVDSLRLKILPDYSATESRTATGFGLGSEAQGRLTVFGGMFVGLVSGLRLIAMPKNETRSLALSWHFCGQVGFDF